MNGVGTGLLIVMTQKKKEAVIQLVLRLGFTDMHPKKVTVLKVTGVDLVTLFYFLVSCNTAYLFYCSRLSDKSVSSVSKQLQVFIIANTLISVNLL